MAARWQQWQRSGNGVGDGTHKMESPRNFSDAATATSDASRGLLILQVIFVRITAAGTL